MAMASFFTPAVAARTGECLGAGLAAFLFAHLLGIEYRSHVEEITFSKPLNVNSVLLLRVVVALLFLVAIVDGMLLVCWIAIDKFPLFASLCAWLPSALFLGMIALTATTWLRNPVAGIVVAGLYLALDLLGGMDLNPVLTLQSLAGSLGKNPPPGNWMVSKVVLLGIAGVMYRCHSRLVVRPQPQKSAARTATTCCLVTAVLLAYVWSGALMKLSYGSTREAADPRAAQFWYSQQFRVYGSVPVVYLAGPAFAKYAGYRGVLLGGTTSFASVDALEEVITQYPRTRWADNAMFELAVKLKRPKPAETARLLRTLAEKFPDSPFTPAGLSILAETANGLGNLDEERWANELLVDKHFSREEAGAAALALIKLYKSGNERGKAEELAHRIARQAAKSREPLVLTAAAESLSQAGETAEAQRLAREALRISKQRVEDLTFPPSDELDINDMRERARRVKARKEVEQAVRRVGIDPSLPASNALP